MPKRPCWVEISTRALEDNYRFLRSVAGDHADCLAVVKADAYGHSLSLCGPAAVRAGADWLGVTSVEEGVAARNACSGARILVMGAIFPGQGAAAVEHGLTPSVWTSHQLDEMKAAARKVGSAAGSVPVHLEIDTGMSRQGVRVEDLSEVLARFTAKSPLRLEAIMTHLYGSDEATGNSSAAQMDRLTEALAPIDALNLPAASRPRWLSVGASAALLGKDAEQISALARRWSLKPLLRIGLALYGVAPRFEPAFAPEQEPSALAASRIKLAPVLSWKTRVVTVSDLPAGAEIGYNGTFVASEPMRVALIAAGYADGLDRRLGNRFSLLVRGQRAPLVGRISMDQAVLDVTEIPDVVTGDEVVILGRQGQETISAYDHADAGETIPWEVFTRIGSRVIRIAV
jgi:alanine racemase